MLVTVIMEQLGHSSLAVTTTYLRHLGSAEVIGTVASLDPPAV